MDQVYIKDDFIKLGQLLKLSGMAASGVDAKAEISEGRVRLNGEAVLQRGKKIFPGDIVSYNGTDVTVCRKNQE